MIPVEVQDILRKGKIFVIMLMKQYRDYYTWLKRGNLQLKSEL
jgi:hypothetical protein